MALKSMELFVNFLDHYKLQNSKEIFLSEANYAKNTEAASGLESRLGKKNTSQAQQLLEHFKSADNSQPKKAKEDQNFRAQMNDIHEKSAKLDKILEKRRLETESKQTTSVNHPSSSLIQDSPFEKKEKPVIAINSHDNKKPLFENPELKAKITPPVPKIPMKHNEKSVNIRELITKKESESTPKQSNFTDSNLHLKTTSNLDSKDQLNDTGRNNKIKKLSIKDSSILNTENNEEMEMITESQGLDMTVDSEALDEFDYVESVEKGKF
jgi:hypothetical protein